MDLNQAAKRVTAKEGGKENLPIAQVKEVIGSYHEVLAEMTPAEFSAHMSVMLTNGEKRLRKKNK